MRSERFQFNVTFPLINTRAGQVHRSTHFFSAQLYSSVVLIAATAVTIGCGGDTGGDRASVDPGTAADEAMELFDKDGSGSLSEAELAASPGLLAVRERYDTDGNQEISQDEIEAGLTDVYSGATTWATAHFRFTQGARPLAGAKVRFVPEPFLEDALHPAAGTTDNQGRVAPAVADEHLPADMKGLHVMQPGIYRVEVDHPSVQKPHKSLGCQVDDQLVRGSTELTFSL